MRIHDIEIYSSKQMLAFIGYLQAWAEDRAKQEEMEKQWQNCGLVGGVLGSGAALANANIAAQATPEYLAKRCAQAIVEKQASEAEKSES